jgi:hypothetical protein
LHSAIHLLEVLPPAAAEKAAPPNAFRSIEVNYRPVAGMVNRRITHGARRAHGHCDSPQRGKQSSSQQQLVERPQSSSEPHVVATSDAITTQLQTVGIASASASVTSAPPTRELYRIVPTSPDRKSEEILYLDFGASHSFAPHLHLLHDYHPAGAITCSFAGEGTGAAVRAVGYLLARGAKDSPSASTMSSTSIGSGMH